MKLTEFEYKQLRSYCNTIEEVSKGDNLTNSFWKTHGVIRAWVDLNLNKIEQVKESGIECRKANRDSLYKMLDKEKTK